MENKSYTLRELTADDMFPMFGIISKIGLKEFKSCFESESTKTAIAQAKTGDEKNIKAVGLTVMLDMASIIFSNIGKCKGDIYQFISGLSGMTTEEIAKLPPAVFFNIIVAIVKKEEFADFFTEVTKLFNLTT